MQGGQIWYNADMCLYLDSFNIVENNMVPLQTFELNNLISQLDCNYIWNGCILLYVDSLLYCFKCLS